MSVITDSIKIMGYLFGPFKKILAIYLVGVILLSFLEVFRISLVYPIINYGLSVENQPRLLDMFYDFILPPSVNPFIASAFLLLITTVIIAGLYGIVMYSGAYVFSEVRDSLDKRVFERIRTRPYSYFAGKKQGDLLYVGQGAVTESSLAINECVELVRYSFMAFFIFFCCSICHSGLQLV